MQNISKGIQYIFIFSLLGCQNNSASDPDHQAQIGLDGGSDSGADSGNDADIGGKTDAGEDAGANDAGRDAGRDAGSICGGACEDGDWTPCTCGPADPCGWSGNGICAGYCIEHHIVEEMFEDEDCNGACTGMCEAGVYLTCTCDASDPCEWSNDGHCDDFCLTGGVVDKMFDDAADCQERHGTN